MSNVSSHNNDLSIPDGVTFVGSINVPGFAQINGDISGEIICKGLVKIFKTGKVTGKLSYAEIDIDRGGQFIGAMTSNKS